MERPSDPGEGDPRHEDHSNKPNLGNAKLNKIRMHYGKQLILGSILLGCVFLGFATIAQRYSSYEWHYDDLREVTHTEVTQIRMEEITLRPERRTNDPEMAWLERWLALTTPECSNHTSTCWNQNPTPKVSARNTLSNKKPKE